MADKKGAIGEVDNAKLEMMRIRFRRALGDSVAAHVIKKTRKNIAKCVRSVQQNEVKNA